MPTKADVTLAATLVHRALLDRSAIEECFRELGDGGRTLAEMLVEKGLLPAEAISALRLELALAEGELPDLFPGYRISERFGEGGMAWVFRARREATNADVALKVLKPAAAAAASTRGQFVREAKLLKGLRHPNLVEGYEVGRIRGFYFLSMEAVEGDSILSYLDQGMAFDEDAALYVVLQIARVLEYLRGHGIVHRDIKPGNILLTADNTVKLCDLGLASTSEDRDAGDEQSTTVGTVEYVSPEQARGRTDIDVRSDIYSLGVSLYHLVLGRLPFEGSDNREVMAKQILESLSSPDMKSRLSPHMHYFIEKMMAKDREIRYQDPIELIKDIESQIEGKNTLTYNPKGRSSGDGPKAPFARDAGGESGGSEHPGKPPAPGLIRRRATRSRRSKRR